MTFFRDPRDYQISVLSGLLVYGLLALDFDVGIVQVAVTLGSVLLIQYACTRLWRLPRFDPKSALISGLSLCLLLRTNFLWLVPVAARHHHRQQVRAARATGQARLQPDQLRHRRPSADHEHDLGVAGAVGQRRVLRLPDGLSRRTRRPSRAAQRRRDCVRDLLRGPAVRTLVLSRRADGDSDPPAAERRTAAVHVLHDFRSAHHARFARRTLPVRRAGRVRRVVRAVPHVPHERPAVVARGVFAADADHRLADARQSLSVEYTDAS